MESYNAIFPEDIVEDVQSVTTEKLDDLVDEIDMDTNNKEEEDEVLQEEEEIEQITKDPVRKFQFIYNESLCMTSKYPEIATSSNKGNIEVAPGEGQVPKDIMSDGNWDIRSFPEEKSQKDQVVTASKPSTLVTTAYIIAMSPLQR